MDPRGSSLIILTNLNYVLMILRDDNPKIPYQNMWGLPGGHVEDNETPKECIVREMKEELGLNFKRVKFLFQIKFDYGIKFIFLTRVNKATLKLNLTEGKGIKWFKIEDLIKKDNLAYQAKEILEKAHEDFNIGKN